VFLLHKVILFQDIEFTLKVWSALAISYVIFQKRVRVFHRGFKHEKTDESTRPQAECFYCFRVFETPMKHEARVFEIKGLFKRTIHALYNTRLCMIDIV